MKILVIEDHADIRKLIRLTLEFEDCELHEAANGADGLEIAQRVQPNLVLLDVMMPGEFDGLEVCRRLKADRMLHTATVVLLTARGQARDREIGLMAGAEEYLVKPFSPLELIDTVKRFWE